MHDGLNQAGNLGHLFRVVVKVCLSQGFATVAVQLVQHLRELVCAAQIQASSQAFFNDANGFADGCWRSGDLGSLDAQGLVRLFDRIKDMINRGGFKIYSVEVENAIMGMAGVIEAAVVGQPCPVLGERVHAHVYAPNRGVDAAAVRAYCATQLADYKVPEQVIFSDTPLPRNPNGKVLKRQLRTT